MSIFGSPAGAGIDLARGSDGGAAQAVGKGTEFRVLLLAPLQNDATLSANFLESAGIDSEICHSERDLCSRLAERPPGAILVAEEALDEDAGKVLAVALSNQPSWSDVPVTIITSGVGEGSEARLRRLRALRVCGKVTLIERPFRPMTLVSALDVALRSRRRQYQVRDLLEERTHSAAVLEQQARIFGTILSTIDDFAYILDRDARFIFANKALLDLWGMELRDALGKNFHDLHYPEDLAHRLAQQVKLVFETAQTVRDETPYTSPQGHPGFYEYIFSPVLGPGGQVEVVVGSTRDVTERKRAEEALREQARSLRDADRRKDEFLAMLAHELRNPLASVLSAASVLKSPGEKDDHAWATGVIERQTGHLAHLIDDLLDVSRITSGKIRLRMERIDAGEVAARACETARPLCSQRKHQVQCEIPRGVLWVEADPLRLEQMILNLLTNAAKYTPPGGLIQLSCRGRGREVVISVVDNGIGIAPDRLPEMFELFAQGERSIERSEGGLGIGLTIVKKLTEMHGGRIEAHSDGLDAGSSFSIVLPAADPPAPGADAGLDGKQKAQLPPLRILVVDDNRDTAEGLARLLRRDGHDVLVAYDGYSAVNQALECVPDVILLDIGLPGMDGFEVAGRIRTGTGGTESLIVALSGYGQEEDRRRSHAAGFDHHLVKPVSFEEVRSVVARVQRSVKRSSESVPIGG